MFHFHIGTHKTGSSTLQRFFYLNKPLLSEFGIQYPDVGFARFGHHLLARSARSGPPRILELEALAREQPSASFLISSEIFEYLHPALIEPLVAAVSPHLVRVFVYVRDFTRAMPSRYGERTRRGRSLDDFDKFFGVAINAPWLQARRPAAAWAEVIGWENIRIRALDPRSLAGGDLIVDALDAIGIPAEVISRTDPESRSIRNKSSHWIAIEAARAIATRLAANGIDFLRRDEQISQGRLRPKSLINLPVVCQQAVVDSQLGGLKAQYLTAPQWRELAARYQADVDQLARESKGPRLPDADQNEPPPRPFLPSINALSGHHKRKLRDALAEIKAVRCCDSTIRDAVLDAIEPQGG
jgi:hypothetical protein